MSGFAAVRNLDETTDGISVKLSKRGLTDNDWDDVNNCPMGLDMLLETRHLFIRRSRHKIYVSDVFSNHFDIVTSSNIRVFTAVEITPDKLRRKKPQKYFKFSLMNSEGTETLLISGTPIHSFKVFHYGNEWGGTTKARDLENNIRMFSIDFVDDEEMDPPKRHEVLQIKVKEWNNDIGLCGCHYILPRDKMRIHTQDIDSEIFLPDGVTKIGRAGWMWDSTDAIECDPKVLGEVTGIRFPVHTDTRIKALLLGALFMLDQRLYKKAAIFHD